MIPYLLVGALLSILAVVSLKYGDSASRTITILIVLIVFTGLRYQIGYDWIAYEKLFNAIPPSFDWKYYNADRSLLTVEPLYYGLNVLIKVMGGDAEMLFFLIAAFNIIVIDRTVAAIYPNGRPIVWMVYFFIALVAVQFNIIRQALASSFVLIALLQVMKGSRRAGVFWLIVSAAIHISTIMFLPVVLVAQRYISDRVVILVVTISAILFLSGALVIGGIGSFLANYAPGFIGVKASAYANGFEAGIGIFGITPTVAVLIILHFGLLYIFCKEQNRTVATNIAIALTLLIIFSHLAISQVPSVWNRVMAVSLVWQIASLLGTKFFQTTGEEQRIISVAMMSIGGLGMMYFQLSRPESLPFVPYHSLVQVWIFGNHGDGRARSEYSIARAEAQEAWGP